MRRLVASQPGLAKKQIRCRRIAGASFPCPFIVSSTAYARVRSLALAYADSAFAKLRRYQNSSPAQRTSSVLRALPGILKKKMGVMISQRA